MEKKIVFAEIEYPSQISGLQAKNGKLYFRLYPEPLKYFIYDFKTLISISETKYLSENFATDKYFYNNTENIVVVSENTLRYLFPEGIVRLFNRDLEILKEYPVNDTMEICDFCIDGKGCFWITDAPFHSVSQYSIKTGEMLYKIEGGIEPTGVLNYPESIICFDNYIYISDMGSKRILRLEIDSKELTVYKEFDKPVWEYARVGDKEIVKLQDGLYLLENRGK